MENSLKSILQNIIPEEHRWKFELFKVWDSVIGNLKHRVFIEKIDQATLFLTVTHPSWAQEIHLLSPMIKKRINAHFNEEKITTIRIKNRMLTQATYEVKKPAASKEVDVMDASLTQQEKTVLAHIVSTDLQSSFAAYFMRCKAQQRR